jgi:hypothetical protein
MNDPYNDFKVGNSLNLDRSSSELKLARRNYEKQMKSFSSSKDNEMTSYIDDSLENISQEDLHPIRISASLEVEEEDKPEYPLLQKQSDMISNIRQMHLESLYSSVNMKRQKELRDKKAHNVFRNNINSNTSLGRKAINSPKEHRLKNNSVFSSRKQLNGLHPQMDETPHKL